MASDVYNIGEIASFELRHLQWIKNKADNFRGCDFSSQWRSPLDIWQTLSTDVYDIIGYSFSSIYALTMNGEYRLYQTILGCDISSQWRSPYTFERFWQHIHMILRYSFIRIEALTMNEEYSKQTLKKQKPLKNK